MSIAVTHLTVPMIDDVISLMDQGEPFIRARTASDYWAYATLFSSTCPVALVDDVLAGAVIAFRSQDDPGEVYVQDVMVHPDHRRQGVTTALLNSVVVQARTWGCTRLWLTSEPGNRTADASWRHSGGQMCPAIRRSTAFRSSQTSRDRARTAPSTSCCRPEGSATIHGRKRSIMAERWSARWRWRSDVLRGCGCATSATELGSLV